MGLQILLADDHEMVRAGLRTIVEQRKEFAVVGEASDGRETVRLALQLRPDVIVIDITMPLLNGVEATRQIVANDPNARVLALSIHTDATMINEIMRAGACGYLVKRSAPGELIDAIRTVASGKLYMSTGIAQQPSVDTNRSETGGPTSSVFSALTSKQREVLQLVAEGMSNKEIAAALSISAKTVEAHRAQIMEKLQIHSTAGLTKYAIREGLTSLDG
jgi:RNA polymerase sigma factor (sigma-70 family)